jgi:hypothetical protein
MERAQLVARNPLLCSHLVSLRLPSVRLPVSLPGA